MARFFQRLKNVRNILYTKYLGVTNVCTTCGLLCLGDVVTQGIEIAYFKVKNPGIDKPLTGQGTEMDFERTGRIFKVGVPYGVMQHYWYKHLDRWFPGTAKATVLRKVVVDTAIAGPTFICEYFYGIALAEGKGFKGSWEALKEVFIPVYTADIIYWPLAQGLNFWLVPNRYRVLVISICALFWNTFLSFVQHLENDPEQDPLHLSLEQHPNHKDTILKESKTKELKEKQVKESLKDTILSKESSQALSSIKQRATVSASSPIQ